MYRLRRFLLATVLGLLVLTLPLLWAGAHLAGEAGRFPDAFAGLDRRPPANPGALDVLLVATYGADPRPSWLPGRARAVSMMLVHVNRDRRGAAVVALPLDASVRVPGHGRKRLGSVFDMGGPGLAVSTVERLSSTRIDQVAVVDWHVFEVLTARLGGLQLALDRREVGPVSPATGAASGYVDGEDVRAFVAEPGIDGLRHLHRELIVLDEVMRGSLHQEMHKHPLLLYRFLDVVASHLAVDDRWSGWDMARFAASQWRLRSADIRYVTAPLTCRRARHACDVVLDGRAAPGFWAAVREDRLEGWLLSHHLRGLANVVRVRGELPAGPT